jgi:hypothetical protein
VRASGLARLRPNRAMSGPALAGTVLARDDLVPFRIARTAATSAPDSAARSEARARAAARRPTAGAAQMQSEKIGSRWCRAAASAA